MPIKKVLIIFNIIGLVGCLIWVVTDPGWEPVVAIVGLIATLIAQLYSAGEGGNRFKMTQKGGKDSTNYQSYGNMTVNHSPTTTINHYGSTETMWIGQTDNSTTSNDNLEGRNSEYFLELVEPVFVNEVNGYTTCLPEQTYKLEIVVKYKSKTETKFYANIYPDAEDYLLHHLAHKDNVKSLGRPLIGCGYTKFQLTGTAPKEPGTYEREVNIGLLHFKDWKNSEVLYNKFYKFSLVIFSTDKSKGPYATSEVNPETGVSFMVLKKNTDETTPKTETGQE
jgi:hypothetical protein